MWSDDEEYRRILNDYGWREDSGARTWFAPDGLPLAGITIRKRDGFLFWETLDLEYKNEIVEVGPEKLELYLASRQPYCRFLKQKMRNVVRWVM